MKSLTVVVIDQEQIGLVERVAEYLDKKGFDVTVQDVPECDVAFLPEGSAFLIIVEDIENREDDV